MRYGFNTAEEISIDIPKVPLGTSIKKEVNTVISKVKETLEILESLENEDEENIIPGFKNKYRNGRVSITKNRTKKKNRR